MLNGHTWLIESVAVSPNGRILASAGWDRTARLWNLDNNQPITGSSLQHADTVRSVSFSEDRKLLSTGCHDKNAYTWDVSAIVKEADLDDLLSWTNVTSLDLLYGTLSLSSNQGLHSGTSRVLQCLLLRDPILTIHHPSPTFFIGLEIFSLLDPVVQRLSCTSVARRSSTFRMPRANVGMHLHEKYRGQ